MFQYFPSNYVWSLSTMIALTHGGNIGEIDAMCAPLREAARAGDDPGTLAFYALTTAIFAFVALWEWGSYHGGWLERIERRLPPLGRVLRRYTDWVLARRER